MWVYCLDAGVFDEVMDLKKHAMEELLLFKHVELSDFQDDFAITHDLDNYKDTSHFSPEISSYLVTCLAKRSHMVTKGNYLGRIEALIRDSHRNLEDKRWGLP